MTRPRLVPQEMVSQALLNIDRTKVIIAAVADYDELPELRGPSWDMEMITEIITENPQYSLFPEANVVELENPTNSMFRDAISDYVSDRSFHGDILILYFSGHGCVLSNGSFGFCLKDTRLGSEDRGVLPLTVVPIGELVGTLAIADVHPVFILDACFSSAASPHGAPLGTAMVEETLRSSNADSFALLASSSSYSISIDTPDGGAFTQALYSIVINGLSEGLGRRSPFITLNQLAAPLQDDLTRMGMPLSRCYVGNDFPILPVAKNTCFRPQSESFTPYMREIIELLWQNGSPREAHISEFSRSIGQGAYANHSKLSLGPWKLVEDAGSNSIRRLTSRGKRFAQRNLRIRKKIICDPYTGDWIADNSSDNILISDI